MDPQFTKLFRASIVARARFIEDLVGEQSSFGISQYIILGAGLDTFAQRNPEVASRLRIFEVDQPGHQMWKRQRLIDLGYGIPEWLQLVPVDFESGESWREKLASSGFDTRQPTIVTSIGVSMYLTREAIVAIMRQVAAFAPRSTFIMTFLFPLELAGPDVRPGFEAAAEGARSSGTPFISYFTPLEILALAHECGFKEARHISAAFLNERYFAGRSDGLRLPNNAEELLVATT